MDVNYDSDWGIFDDKFLLYSKEQIDDFKQPFFATIFTISSHHPYVLPEEYKNSFDEKKPELNALRYADFSLQKFFEAARSSNWFNNTIFVFVADHTSPFSFEPDVTSAYISPIDRHRVPIVCSTNCITTNRLSPSAKTYLTNTESLAHYITTQERSPILILHQ